MTSPTAGGTAISAVVVTYDSALVIDACLAALARSAPRRGVRVMVVDNASRDDSAERAERRLGREQVMRLSQNRGFAAGVNAAARGFLGDYLAVINPDAETPHGSLDSLADILDAGPRAGLVAPRVVTGDGVPERSVGYFPTLRRGWRQALYLHALPGVHGRLAPFPARTAAVDWVSGCAWLLRGDALRAVGPLCEEYFMYWEDVDYCRRLHDAGWQILATPDVTILHTAGSGSRGTDLLPADGGLGQLRYFARFHPEVAPSAVRRMMMCSVGLRRWVHAWRGRWGDHRSAALARRYALTLDLLRGRPAAAPRVPASTHNPPGDA